jgi:hypothetical protein
MLFGTAVNPEQPVSFLGGVLLMNLVFGEFPLYSGDRHEERLPPIDPIAAEIFVEGFHL